MTVAKTLGRAEDVVKSIPGRVLKQAKRWFGRKPVAWPRLTVVTPTFNAARHLAATIESVLSQGYPNLEYIVADGGSTDGTLAILERYRKDIDLIVPGPDRGMYDAVAKGFDRATGEVFAYLNADDLFEPGALRRVGEYFFRHPRAQVVYHDDTVDVGGWRFANARQPARVNFLSLLRGHILFQDGVFFRRAAYEAVGGLDRTMKLAGDWHLWTRLARRFRFTRLPGHRSCFRVRADQLSADAAAYLAEMDRARRDIVAALTPAERRYWHVVNASHRVVNKLDRLTRPARLHYPLAHALPEGVRTPPPPPGDAPPADAAVPRCPLTGEPPEELLFSTRDTRFTDPRINHVYYHGRSHLAVTHPPLDERDLEALYREHYSRPERSRELVHPVPGHASPFRGYRGGGPWTRLPLRLPYRHRLLRKFATWGVAAWEDSTVEDVFAGLGAKAAALRQRPLRVLDVGCFEGNLLAALAAKTRWQLCGLEPNRDAVAAARGRGFRVWHGPAEDATLLIDADVHFDLIVMSQTIEHLNQPARAVRRLGQLLTPGGKLIVTTPNLDAAQIDLFGPTWSHWHAPYHRFLFSRKSLELLADTSELELLWCRTRSHPFWTVLSMQLNRLGLGGSVSHNVNLEGDLAQQAAFVTAWARCFWDPVGRGDYLIATFRRTR